MNRRTFIQRIAATAASIPFVGGRKAIAEPMISGIKAATLWPEYPFVNLKVNSGMNATYSDGNWIPATFTYAATTPSGITVMTDASPAWSRPCVPIHPGNVGIVGRKADGSLFLIHADEQIVVNSPSIAWEPDPSLSSEESTELTRWIQERFAKMETGKVQVLPLPR